MIYPSETFNCQPSLKLLVNLLLCKWIYYSQTNNDYLHVKELVNCIMSNSVQLPIIHEIKKCIYDVFFNYLSELCVGDTIVSDR